MIYNPLGCRSRRFERSRTAILGRRNSARRHGPSGGRIRGRLEFDLDQRAPTEVELDRQTATALEFAVWSSTRWVGSTTTTKLRAKKNNSVLVEADPCPRETKRGRGRESMGYGPFVENRGLETSACDSFETGSVRLAIPTPSRRTVPRLNTRVQPSQSGFVRSAHSVTSQLGIRTLEVPTRCPNARGGDHRTTAAHPR